MKKLLEDVHDEPASRFDSVGKRSMPKISYKQAMLSFFVQANQVHQVSRCEAADFQDFVDECSALVKKPLCGALKSLHFSEQIDRWYAINVLLEHKATVELFGSEKEAQASIAQVTSPPVKTLHL